MVFHVFHKSSSGHGQDVAVQKRAAVLRPRPLPTVGADFFVVAVARWRWYA